MHVKFTRFSPNLDVTKRQACAYIMLLVLSVQQSASSSVMIWDIKKINEMELRLKAVHGIVVKKMVFEEQAFPLFFGYWKIILNHRCLVTNFVDKW